MANEYLKRTPTSSGNRRVFTWSAWVKLNNNPAAYLFTASPAKDNNTMLRVTSGGALEFFDRPGSDAGTEQVRYIPLLRDYSSWTHILFNADTTQTDAVNRVRAFINGVELSRDATNTLLNNAVAVDTPPKNQEFWRLNGAGYAHYIGALLDNTLLTSNKNQLTDVFFVDGQALTPNVFGYYKKRDGYISAGSTQSTDFKRGQWVPKAPKVIKSVINARGGFGVNGFYLPMNDVSNFGADFHCEPNSIIKLKGEDFNEYPQPRNGAPTTTDAYVSQLRDDPFKDYLVLAIPGINGGKESGCGDYSGDIKGTGVNKILTRTGSVNASEFSSYYGSCLNFNNNGYIQTSSSSDYDLNDEDFTVEFWSYHSNNTSTPVALDNDITTYCPLVAYPQNGNVVFYASSNGSSWDIASNKIIGPFVYDQWNHIAVCRKGSTFYLLYNGVVTNTFTSSLPIYQGSNRITIGRVQNNATFVGKVQDFRFYKGVAKYTSGFDIVKPYTPVGIASWRAVPDTTVNNFATLNPLLGAPITGNVSTFVNGNLTKSQVNTSRTISTISTPKTGKWYAEFRASGSGSIFPYTGVALTNSEVAIIGGQSNAFQAANLVSYTGVNYHIFNSTTTQSETNPPGLGDVLGVALDVDNGVVYYYKNGALLRTDNTLFKSENYVFSVQTTNDGVSGTSWYTLDANFGQNPTFSGNTTAGTYTDSNGKGLFKYQPPSGFLALCEDNLPTPAIKNPGEHFKTVLYTGDGNAGRSITGIGFTPDLVWTKERNIAYDHAVYDSVRGAARYLTPNGTAAETVDNTSLLSFNSDGFTLGNWAGENVSGTNYVAWCWRAGAGTTTANTAGSIPSVVSVNQDAGFSIVSYTGNGTIGATVGHGLGKKPKFFMTKNRDTAALDWPVFSEELLGSNGYIYLNKTTAAATIANISGPTSSVLTLSGYNDNNKSGDRFIAYCWAEIEGFSKFGSYVGNGSADGPFVFTNGRPAFVMIKRTDSTANWFIFDNSRNSTNPNLAYLVPNATDIESSSGGDMDFLSNGFKIRNTSTSLNASGGTYIFAAFAESPFTTANAK